jgi:hypothetical protein
MERAYSGMDKVLELLGERGQLEKKPAPPAWVIENPVV